MLDATLFNVNLPTVPSGDSKALILSGCRVILPVEIAYSEFDELSFYALNCNDYDYGRADIELSFENKFRNPYFKYFVRCVTIRTDRKILCKIDGDSTPKMPLTHNYTKITKEGKVALGISYHFKSLEERELLMECRSFCVEGFAALKSKTNVYGIMCRIAQTQNGWQMSEGNTYQIYDHANIMSLYH